MIYSRTLFLFFLLKLIVFINSYSQNVTIKNINDFAPNLYEKSLTNRSFNFKNFSITFDKLAFYKKNIFYIFSLNGDEIAIYNNIDFNLENFSVGHFEWDKTGNKILLCTHGITAKKQSGLFLIDIVKKNVKEIISTTIQNEYILQISQPSWSFDSKLISYIKATRKGTPLFIKNLVTGEEIQVGNPVSGNAKWLNHSLALLYRNLVPPYNTPKPPDAYLWYYNYETRENKQLISEKIPDIEIEIMENDSLFLVKTQKGVLICQLNGKINNVIQDDGGVDYKFSPDGKFLTYLLPVVNDQSIIRQYLILLNLKIDEKIKYSVSTDINNYKWLNNSMIVLIK